MPVKDSVSALAARLEHGLPPRAQLPAKLAQRAHRLIYLGRQHRQHVALVPRDYTREDCLMTTVVFSVRLVSIPHSQVSVAALAAQSAYLVRQVGQHV